MKGGDIHPGSEPGNERIIGWRSRRGMLELDLLLVPFARLAYPKLGGAAQAAYRRLLAEEDQDLYRWLIRKENAGDLQAIVERILAHHEERAANASPSH